MITLADERDEHAPAVERLLDATWGEERWHKTCQRLRDGRDPLRKLSLVAIKRGALIGSVRLWPVQIGRRPSLLLGPLAVDAAWRDKGVGSALMSEALRRAEAAGNGSVLLVGDADYYRRFGFTPEPTTRLWLPGPVARERFLAKELRSGALDGAKGDVRPLAA
jgi:predicted N-acetyltransferase YhbS